MTESTKYRPSPGIKNILFFFFYDNFSTEIDTRAEKIGYKIREARLQKIPYMLVVGAKEEEENTVSVRSRFAGDEGAKSLDDFIAAITEEIKNRENRKVEVEEQK